MAEHWRDESGLNLQLMELVLPKLGQKMLTEQAALAHVLP